MANRVPFFGFQPLCIPIDLCQGQGVAGTARFRTPLLNFSLVFSDLLKRSYGDLLLFAPPRGLSARREDGVQQM